jgi:hypothetical protein
VRGLAQRRVVHVLDVHLHDVHDVQQRLELVLAPGEVVEREREAGALQLQAALHELVGHAHRLEDLEHDLVAREQLDDIAHDERGAQVDEAGVLAEHRLHPKLAEGMVDHGGAGEDVVLDLRAVEVARAEQQLERREILVAIQDRLAAQEELVRLLGHDVVSGFGAQPRLRDA